MKNNLEQQQQPPFVMTRDMMDVISSVICERGDREREDNSWTDVLVGSHVTRGKTIPNPRMEVFFTEDIYHQYLWQSHVEESWNLFWFYIVSHTQRLTALTHNPALHLPFPTSFVFTFLLTPIYQTLGWYHSRLYNYIH